MNIRFLILAAPCLLFACETAPPVRRGTFQLRHALEVDVPEGARQVRVWLVLPQEDPAQEVRDLRVESPAPYREVRDSEGNRLLHVEASDPALKKLTIVTTFALTRSEVRADTDPGKAGTLEAADGAALRRHLEPNQNVIVDEKIRKLAAEIVKDEKNPIRASRAIYDWVLHNIDYWVKDPANLKASPVGSSEYCLSTKTGNCTDFHSLWASLARAAGIPTRLVYGSLLKTELDGKDEDQSYHCWIEFLAPGAGWIPLDVAVADIYVGDFRSTPENDMLVRRTTADGYRGPEPSKVDYYFGSLDERRVTWSSGRDIVLEPRQAGDPLNALPKAYVEVDGKPLAEKTGWRRKLTYTQVN